MRSESDLVLEGRFEEQTELPASGRGEPVTNGSILKAKFARTVLESNATRADEHLVVEDLRRATKMVARTLFDLLS